MPYVWHTGVVQRCLNAASTTPLRGLNLTSAACCCTVFEQLVVRSASSERTIVDDDVDANVPQKRARAVAKEKCPQCGNPEMEYFTMQLRSADEGQTVFYECPKCGHTFSTNT